MATKGECDHLSDELMEQPLAHDAQPATNETPVETSESSVLDDLDPNSGIWLLPK